MRKLLLATIASTALSGAAWAGPCAVGSAASYQAAGFSCSVGTVTFSNIKVNTTTNGTGAVVLGNFTPISFGNENGLSLNYSANTGLGGGTADVAWTYNVASAPPMTDAFASFAGNTSPTGALASLDEELSNGVSLKLNAPGAVTQVFAPVGNLSVVKDQNDFAAEGSFSTTSVLQNAFSTGAAVPEPASLALLGFGLIGVGFIRRRRG